MEWKLIDTAPRDRDLQLAVIDTKGTLLVAFPCRRLADDRWIDAETSKQVCFHRLRNSEYAGAFSSSPHFGQGTARNTFHKRGSSAQ